MQKHLIVTALYFFTAPLFSQSISVQPPGKIIGFLIKDGEEKLDPMLYGGRPIKENELRPSVNIGNCTGTVIGPNTLITAGHCRSSGSGVSFSFNRTSFSGSCTRHPDYSSGGWLNNDFALCKFSPAWTGPLTAYLSKRTLKVGDQLTMQGYGAGSNGRLNVGEAVIQSVDYMDYITEGPVFLGGGDSGGGLFARVKDLVNGPFEWVGVNSRGGGRTSLFNRSDLERSWKFFNDWTEKNKEKVCGVNLACGGAGEDPTVPCYEEGLFVAYALKQVTLAEGILAQCKK